MEYRSKEIVDLVMHTTGTDLTLLVVPDFNSQGKLSNFPFFCSWLRDLKDAGVEIAQHGLTHTGRSDERTFGGRYLTAGEGEFASACVENALERIRTGFKIMSDVMGEEPSGFTAPAWLYSRETVEVLQQFPFQWVEYRTGIRYHKGKMLYAPVVIYASRTLWKRFCSRVWARFAPSLFYGFNTVRYAAHVRDLPSLETALFRSLIHLCAGRKCLTTAEGAVK
ncbi:hypothetical protein CSA37_12315 [Candidatus Fermentibacteria bacterium]|nr:MAG: hypothetical protein CSA37_12315 [Candidatus Fermentibacteria bacterium]